MEPRRRIMSQDERLTFDEMWAMTQVNESDAEQSASIEDDPDYRAAKDENDAARARNRRKIAAIGLGYPDWPDEVLDAIADDDGDLSKEISRQVTGRKAKAALIARDEWKLSRKPLDIATLDELLARPATPWRIKSRENVNVPGTGGGLIPAESNTLVVGQAKIGKTTFLGNLIHSLITGEPFLGRYNEINRVTGAVVVLNYEVTGRTYGQWLHEMEVPRERLHIISLRGAPNPFVSVRARAELIEALQERKCEVLIVDPLAQAFVGRTQNQNDAGEVANWYGLLNEIKLAAGIPDAIVSAHAGWEGERVRGSSGLYGVHQVYMTDPTRLSPWCVRVTTGTYPQWVGMYNWLSQS
jgi:hypothetical protein